MYNVSISDSGVAKPFFRFGKHIPLMSRSGHNLLLKCLMIKYPNRYIVFSTKTLGGGTMCPPCKAALAPGSAAPDVHALLGVASESKNAKCRLHKVAQRYALSTRYVV